jgi:ABC-type Fe3+ transport system permease subunit
MSVSSMHKTYSTASARIPALLGGALIVAILIVLVAAPLGNILLQAFSTPQGTAFALTARNLERVLSEEIYWTALINTRWRRPRFNGHRYHTGLDFRQNGYARPWRS